MKFAVAAVLAALVSAGAPVVEKKADKGLKDLHSNGHGHDIAHTGYGKLANEPSKAPVLGDRALAHGDRLGAGYGVGYAAGYGAGYGGAYGRGYGYGVRKNGYGRLGPAVSRVGRVDDYGAGLGGKVGFGSSYTRGLGIRNQKVGVAGKVGFDETDVGSFGTVGVNGRGLGGAAQARHGYGKVGYSMGPTGMTAQLGNFTKSGYRYDIDEYGTKGEKFGLNGVNGLLGLKGLRGVHNRLGGVQSLGGVRGLKGLTGLNGVDNNLNKIQSLGGVQGLSGLQGLDNQLGGIQSLGGVQSLQGLRGLQGVNNNLGGINSLNGVEGLNGVQGLDGLDNRLGIASLQGVEGMNGLQGLDGIRGETFDRQGYGEVYDAYSGVGYGSDRVGYGGQHGFDYNIGSYGGYGVNSRGAAASGIRGRSGVTGITGPAIGTGLTQFGPLGGLRGVNGGISPARGITGNGVGGIQAAGVRGLTRSPGLQGQIQGRGGVQGLTAVQARGIDAPIDGDDRGTQGVIGTYGVSASQGGVSRTYDSAPNYRGYGPNYAQRVGDKRGYGSNIGYSRSSSAGYSYGSPIASGYGGYGKGLW